MKNNFEKEINWLLKEKYFGKETKEFFNDVKKIKAGEPVDYIIGFTEFLGNKIDLSKKPLIPRPETEFWVSKFINEALRHFVPQGKSLSKLRVLDIFSGSGCIGVAIAKNIPDLLPCPSEAQQSEGGCEFEIISSDKSPEAISQIKINYKLNNIDKKRYKVIESDVFENISKKYNFILANPPYIPTKNKSKVQKSTLKYEPKQALFGGGDGLFFIKKFLKQAKSHLTKNGTIYMEFDSPQKTKINQLLKKYKYTSWQFCKDQYGKWRFVVIQ